MHVSTADVMNVVEKGDKRVKRNKKYLNGRCNNLSGRINIEKE